MAQSGWAAPLKSLIFGPTNDSSSVAWHDHGEKTIFSILPHEEVPRRVRGRTRTHCQCQKLLVQLQLRPDELVNLVEKTGLTWPAKSGEPVARRTGNMTN